MSPERRRTRSAVADSIASLSTRSCRSGRDTPEDVIAIDEALEALAKNYERKSQVVELRFFGGLSVEETAEVLNVSPDTVMRDWKFAKTWLMRELSRTRDGRPMKSMPVARRFLRLSSSAGTPRRDPADMSVATLARDRDRHTSSRTVPRKAMTTDQRKRITGLYHAALERPPAERGTFLDEVCAGDAALREEVESLLRIGSDADGLLETPAMEVVARGVAGMVGRQLGPFRVLGALGAGGMGEVYRARDSKLGRDVAIKLLPPLFTRDPERRARFAREARLLATLNHPHIGAIYGLEEMGGETALVLELVEGADARRASRARAVCQCLTPSRSRVRSPRRSTPRTRKASSIAI